MSGKKLLRWPTTSGKILKCKGQWGDITDTGSSPDNDNMVNIECTDDYSHTAHIYI